MECKLCACLQFRPNQWRKTLCQHCYHGASAHTSDPRAGVPQWYYAKVEGPFTWEQMRHWYEAGYFNTDKLLVKNAEELGPHYIPLKSAFPKEEEAFVPRGEVSAVEQVVDEDAERQVSPAEVRAKLPWMTRYFGRGTAWHFIDAQGEPQGPFPPDNMANWFKAGYFWNKELLICHEGWESYVSLDSIMQASDTLDLDTPSSAATRSVSEPSIPVPAAVPVDVDAVVVTLPSATSVLGVEGAVHVDSPEQGSSEGDEAPEVLEWYYADETGAAQGPFSAQQMSSWFEWAYFGDATLVKHESAPRFCAIAELFPPGSGGVFEGTAWQQHFRQ